MALLMLDACVEWLIIWIARSRHRRLRLDFLMARQLETGPVSWFGWGLFFRPAPIIPKTLSRAAIKHDRSPPRSGTKRA